ncbi:MAG: 16S rRNA (adenine(1518)-N(6)/adenine(1519)-N(6))-dimethyltransferase RsmA [Lactobacillus sp.]|jgi:16S rRNA (adenine1518-N6/adenine1519-N6)-dimethyltransferase|nr:16S rRNA (adenine(1518)-N(6)/adenine(1519)-N(6))-dimethyltransferase RsmA [Lactobacillus sp.]MCH3905815.1 16S rRNA (adenine(1518)-N(6)/adenine(1519)-N(6))-dimethyltransferase RsmA [Lactobacillus sp.]MCH3990604.1 16S rRNA (adenine(1518)-N(6)/adenine(1519)-N(6))-dimethyltransferase RsmA [Lactobacillus sp.]MCH4068680.1 16S rRNA (adenine(1518)-N(6)/adenine(1519)-N(6))-dimethyltransferase RsmA [Lactobacillus sp.]MCI1303835.1 16S rRNA (adenine(1518)-N(6)/adenine(1519)-N(6))-dimethyltransferase Rsm
MTNIPIADPVRTQAIVNRYLKTAKKSLGQNFLIDLNAIEQILAAAEIQPGDQVIEIGPGIGSMTEQLLLAGAKVLAYEVDDRLPEILQNELPQDHLSDFKLVMQDVLQADFKHDLAGFFALDQPVKIVANLPYYITTPIIFNLLNSELNFTSLTLMMQQEVADRIAAEPGGKDYGPLTLAVQNQMQVELALAVSHRSFWPQPKVDSAVLVLKPLPHPQYPGQTADFNRLVKMCFAQRRKTLNNNLKAIIPAADQRAEILAEVKLPANIRPEKLSLDQFISLVSAIVKYKA